MTSESLRNCYRDEMNDDAKGKNDNDYSVNTGKATTSRSFQYKTKIIESTPGDNNILDIEVAIPLKDLSIIIVY